MDLERASDERLVAAPGNRHAGDAFAEFYRRYELPIHAYFVRRVSDIETAADLAATAFAEALAARRRFRDRGNGSAAAWLYGISSHVLSRHYRTTAAEQRRNSQLVRELPALSYAQIDELALLKDDGKLQAAVAELPRVQREAVYAYVVAEDTYAEIARRTDVDPATARKPYACSPTRTSSAAGFVRVAAASQARRPSPSPQQ